MSSLSTNAFLTEIDPELVQYTDLLISKGFNNTRLLAHLTYQDIPELPIGHKRLLINEVTKIRSPHSKSLLTSLDTQSMQCFSATGTDERTTRSLPHNQDSLSRKELFPDIVPEEDEFIQKYEYASPMEKHLRHVISQIESKEN